MLVFLQISVVASQIADDHHGTSNDNQWLKCYHSGTTLK